MNLKPNEEIQVSAITAAMVLAIFQLDAPNLADTRNAQGGNPHIHGSVKTAAWTATAVTAGVALLAKSPTVFVVGGLTTVIESWKLFHANATHPHTGQVVPQLQGSGG